MRCASEVGSGYAASSVDHDGDGGPGVVDGRELHDGGLVASAMPLCDTCAVRPPSMTSSAPL